MKNIIRLVFGILFVLACGAPIDVSQTDTSDPELGTLEQAIYADTGYGIQHDSAGYGCGNFSWGGGVCWMPDNVGDTVVIDLYFQRNTCTGYYNSSTGRYWMRDRIDEAMTYFKNQLQAAHIGWVVNFKDSAANATTVKCGTLAGNALGKFQPVANEQHSTAFGTLAQFHRGTLTIDEYKLYATSGWAGATNQQRVNISANVVRHELFHHAGTPHKNPNGSGNALMDGTFSHTDTSKAVWQNTLGITGTEWGWIDCYNPTSGTADRC
jgi:hypothetical protein